MKNPLTLNIDYNCSSMILSKGKNGRKLFLSEFTHFLNEKLFENGINCRLVMKYNWFRNEIFRKKIAIFGLDCTFVKLGTVK